MSAAVPFRGASNLARPARRIRWKNVMCDLCRFWIDRERVVEHRDSPLHQRMLALQRGAA